MHKYGDAWFKKNGDDLDNAIRYCVENWGRWGRINTHGKEKYGTFRDHVDFYQAWWAIHELVKPGYAYYQWPKGFIYRADLLLGRFVRFTRLHLPVRKYQAFIYNLVIQEACRRYPNIVDEIVSSLDHYELVKPGFFGPIDGEKIHNQYRVSFGDLRKDLK